MTNMQSAHEQIASAHEKLQVRVEYDVARLGIHSFSEDPFGPPPEKELVRGMIKAQAKLAVIDPLGCHSWISTWTPTRAEKAVDGTLNEV
jgi:hypothetical protein